MYRLMERHTDMSEKEIARWNERPDPLELADALEETCSFDETLEELEEIAEDMLYIGEEAIGYEVYVLVEG